MLSDLLVTFDHLKHTVIDPRECRPRVPSRDIERAYAAAAETIAEVRSSSSAGPVPRERHGVREMSAGPGAVGVRGADRARGADVVREGGETEQGREMPSFQSNMERAEFGAMVARIVELHPRGRRLSGCSLPAPWSARRCRCSRSRSTGVCVRSASPYMYFLDFGDFQVVEGASPEPAADGERAPRLDAADRRDPSARGQRPRRTGGSRGAATADEKERAEHVMLVDLGAQRSAGSGCASTAAVTVGRADGDLSSTTAT